MPPATYQPVDTRASGHPHTPGRSSTSSQNSTHLTPDFDSEDEREDLEDLEADEGYELSDLRGSSSGSRGRRKAAATRDGEEEESDEEEDEVEAAKRERRRRRRTSVQSFELYTPDEERRVRRKLDTHLVLFVAMLYLMSFLDRSNIGNAKIAGLTDDLNLSSDQYEWLLTAFYIAYILFEWMTLCYTLFPPHIYVSCCVAAWGILASLQSLAPNFAVLLVLRALLGIGEAAFVGIPFYLSFFFKRDELAFRTGLFISAAPLATSFASSLAWAIVKFGDGTGIASWRLLFLLEGFPACIVAVWTWWWLPDSPSSTRWLNARERKIATLRMRNESAGSSSTSAAKSPRGRKTLPRHKRPFQWREVRNTLANPIVYLTAAMFFCCNVAFSSMPVFLPTIVHQMGFSPLTSQALAAPPFLFSFLIVLPTAILSDRLGTRSIPMAFHALLAALGYAALALAGHFELGFVPRYIAVFPICAGFFSAVTIVITWTVNNQASDEGKGTGMAVLNFIGQLGPLLGTRLYPDAEGPYYVKGMNVCAGAMGLVAVLALTLRGVLRRKNEAREKGVGEEEGERLVGGGRRRGGDEAGFIYIT